MLLSTGHSTVTPVNIHAIIRINYTEFKNISQLDVKL